MKTPHPLHRTRLLAGAFFALAAAAVQAAFNDAWPDPVNNPPEDITFTYTDDSGSRDPINFDTTGTTKTGDPTLGGVTGTALGWFYWKPSETGVVKLTLRGSDQTQASYSTFDSLLGVFGLNSAGTGRHFLAFNNNIRNESATGAADGDDSSEVYVKVEAGKSYWIAVDTVGATTGAAQLDLVAASAPANDDLANAQVISSLNTDINGSNATATYEGLEPQHNGLSTGASVWYKWTPTAADAGLHVIKTVNSQINPLVSVYASNDGSGSLSSLVPLSSANNKSTTDFEAECYVNAIDGQTLYIAVDGLQTLPIEIGASTDRLSRGNFTLRVESSAGPRPANDDFQNAIQLTMPSETPGDSVTATGSNVFATHQLTFNVEGLDREEGQPVTGQSAFKSVWYKYVPNENYNVIVDTNGSDFDTILAVYSVIQGNYVASDNDSGIAAASGGNASQLEFRATAGDTFYIRVDGRNSTSTFPRSGNYSLKIKRATTETIFPFKSSWQMLASTTDPVGANASFLTTWANTALLAGAAYTPTGLTAYSGTPAFTTNSTGAFAYTGGSDPTPELNAATSVSTNYDNAANTLYLKRTFTLDQEATLVARVTADDGCVIYIDGVRRGFADMATMSNPPDITQDAAYTKLAVNATGTEVIDLISLGLVPAGDHVIAVTAHGYNNGDQGIDIALDFTMARPDIGNISDQTALVGQAFTYAVPIVDNVAINGNLTMTPVSPTTAIPTWLTIAGATISGTPPAGSNGDYFIRFTGTNGNGTGSPGTLKLTVALPAEPVLSSLGTGTGFEQAPLNVSAFNPSASQSEVGWVINKLTPASGALAAVGSGGTPSTLRFRTVAKSETLISTRSNTYILDNAPATIAAPYPSDDAAPAWGSTTGELSAQCIQKFGDEDYRVAVGPVAKGSFGRVIGSVDFRGTTSSTSYFETDDNVRVYLQHAASKTGPWTTFSANADVLPLAIGGATAAGTPKNINDNDVMTNGRDGSGNRQNGDWLRHRSAQAAIIPSSANYVRMVIDCNNDSDTEWFMFDNAYLIGAEAPVEKPILAAVSNLSVIIPNQSVSIQLGASNGVTVTEYLVNGLPAGVSYASTSGLISGTPTTTGTFNISATGSNAQGTSDPIQFTMTVANAASFALDATGVGTGFELAPNLAKSFLAGTGMNEVHWEVGTGAVDAAGVLTGYAVAPADSASFHVVQRTTGTLATSAALVNYLVGPNAPTTPSTSAPVPTGDGAMTPGTTTASLHALQRSNGTTGSVAVVGPVSKGTFQAVKASVETRSSSISATYFEASDIAQVVLESSASPTGPFTFLGTVLPQKAGDDTDGGDADLLARINADQALNGDWLKHESGIFVFPVGHSYVRMVIYGAVNSNAEYLLFDNALLYGAEPPPDKPILAAVNNLSLVVPNQAVSIQLTLSNTAAVTGFDVTGLPAGVTFDATTGLISGTPTAIGTFNVSATASNNFGTSDPVQFTITTAQAANFTLTAEGVGTGFELAADLDKRFAAVPGQTEVHWEVGTGTVDTAGVLANYALAPADSLSFHVAQRTTGTLATTAALVHYLVGPNAPDTPSATSPVPTGDGANTPGGSTASLHALQRVNGTTGSVAIVGPVAKGTFNGVKASVETRSASISNSFFESDDVGHVVLESSANLAGPYTFLGTVLTRAVGDDAAAPSVAADTLVRINAGETTNGDWAKHESPAIAFPEGHNYVRMVIYADVDSNSEYLLFDNVSLMGQTITAELDTDGDGMPDSYETANGLNPNDAGDKMLDKDNDGQPNYLEFLAGTLANNPTSTLKILDVTPNAGGTTATVTFPTVSGKKYKLQTSLTLATGSWTDAGVANVTGNGTIMSFSVPIAAGQRYARIQIVP